jgi:hypothetical protein
VCRFWGILFTLLTALFLLSLAVLIIFVMNSSPRVAGTIQVSERTARYELVFRTSVFADEANGLMIASLVQTANKRGSPDLNSYTSGLIDIRTEEFSLGIRGNWYVLNYKARGVFIQKTGTLPQDEQSALEELLRRLKDSNTP